MPRKAPERPDFFARQRTLLGQAGESIKESVHA